jgi:hypothetical protein
LRVPSYDEGTITAIADADGDTYIDWQEAWEAGFFYLWREDGWQPSQYTITADFGYGLPPPEIVEVTRQLAINIWFGRQRGLFSDVIGVETSPGGAAVVGYQGAMTNQQRMVVSGVIRRYHGFMQ